ncbi:MAG TPA: hypothetical protein VFR11_10850 [Micromonosporaceae bacterium]|nr:hypothetical protein [Micromonosporaceae bacterium]
MPTDTALPRFVAAVTAVTVALVLAACTSGGPPVVGNPTSTAVVPTTPVDPAGQLAGLAAAAHDRWYVAAYTISGPGNRTLLASLATDGTWQVDVDNGTLSSEADIAIVGIATGTYQCVLGGAANALVGAGAGTGSAAGTGSETETGPPAAAASGSPSPGTSPTSSPSPPRVRAPSCVKVAQAGGRVPARYDPVFEHIFTDWPGVMLDRNAPISVSVVPTLPHASGACYSVEPSAVSLAPVMGAGIFCFAPDGTLTAAKINEGTVVIAGPAVAPAPTITLPAPVTDGPAVPVSAP